MTESHVTNHNKWPLILEKLLNVVFIFTIMWIYFDVLKDSDTCEWFQCSIHLLKMVAKISPRLLYKLAKIYFNYSIQLSILMTFLMTKKRYRSWHRKPLFRYLSRKVQSNLECSNYLVIHYKTGMIFIPTIRNSLSQWT